MSSLSILGIVHIFNIDAIWMNIIDMTACEKRSVTGAGMMFRTALLHIVTANATTIWKLTAKVTYARLDFGSDMLRNQGLKTSKRGYLPNGIVLDS